MTPARIILHADTRPGALCIDDTSEGALVTFWSGDDADEQVLLPSAEARRLGEWLIKRANEGGGDTA